MCVCIFSFAFSFLSHRLNKMKRNEMSTPYRSATNLLFFLLPLKKYYFSLFGLLQRVLLFPSELIFLFLSLFLSCTIATRGWLCVSNRDNNNSPPRAPQHADRARASNPSANCTERHKIRTERMHAKEGRILSFELLPSIQIIVS